MPSDWKPMSSVGAGVVELRVQTEDGAFRLMYIAKFAEAIYVLHAFQKKSKAGIATPRPDVELVEKRLKAVLARYGLGRG